MRFGEKNDSVFFCIVLFYLVNCLFLFVEILKDCFVIVKVF